MSKRSYIVIGLHFGDEGKGTVVDFLARENENPVIVRTGGPQAAHNVVTPDGLHHTFSQLGSGMFVEGAKTFLSSLMYVHPLALMTEHKIFEEKVGRDITSDIYIDSNCPIVTPYHREAGRIYARRNNRSTCAMGVGMAVRDMNCGVVLQVKDTSHPDRMVEKLKKIIEINEGRIGERFDSQIKIDSLIDMYREFNSAYQIVSVATKLYRECVDNTIIFETSQGVLLNSGVGFDPHTTQLPFNNVRAFAQNIYTRPFIIGVTRSYAHRHGRGPLPTENMLEIPESHNTDNKWQGEFRTGLFDPVLFNYALRCSGIDALAVTHLDRFPGAYPLVNSYVYNGQVDDTQEFVFQESFRYGKRLGELEITNIISARYTGDYLDNCAPFINKCNDYMIEDSEEFLVYLKSMFKKPVAIASYGPCATDKKWVTDV